MNGVKILKYFDRMNTREIDVVTHADYRALEEDRDMWFRDHGIIEAELREAREELAALRVRHEMVRQCCMDETVRATRLMGDLEELKKKADELYSADQAFDGAYGGGSREEQVHAGMRRRLALEGLK